MEEGLTEIKVLDKYVKNKRTYCNFICHCGSIDSTRHEYVKKIKSCKSCRRMSIDDKLPEGYLWCNKCSSSKKIECFNIRKDGKKRLCRECESSYAKENRQRLTFQSKEWNKNNPEKRMYFAAKKRAEINGIDFNIDLSDIIIPEKCPVLGIDIITDRSGNKINSPSIDRIDSSLGYIKGNVSVISWRANWIKNNATLEEIEKLYKYMASLKK